MLKVNPGQVNLDVLLSNKICKDYKYTMGKQVKVNEIVVGCVNKLTTVIRAVA